MEDKYTKPMFILQTYDDRMASKELSQKLSEKLVNVVDKEIFQKKQKIDSSKQASSTTTTTATTTTTTTTPPPPPPPLPLPSCNENNLTLKPSNKKTKAPSIPTEIQNQPPLCPTPDYDSLSLKSTSSSLMQNGTIKNKTSQQIINDAVEMESLESYKLTTLKENKPKPPDTYFNKNSYSTLGKNKPVSVTIGEYPSGTIRKQPGRLDFLNNNNDLIPMANRFSDSPITSQFTSELEQTLSRSNLRKRIESVINSYK